MARQLTDDAKTTDGLAQFYPSTLATAAQTAKTADYTVLATEMGVNFTNSDASGTVVFTLPPAAQCPNKTVKFACLAAQIVRVDPNGTEKIYLNGSGVAGKYVNIAAVIGNFVDLFCDGVNWHVTHLAGVVTKEA